MIYRKDTTQNNNAHNNQEEAGGFAWGMALDMVYDVVMSADAPLKVKEVERELRAVRKGWVREALGEWVQAGALCKRGARYAAA